METEQQFKDAAREWLERDDAAPAWVEHRLLSLAALIQREAGRCVREHDRHVRFSSFREDKGRMAWAFEEQEDDG